MVTDDKRGVYGSKLINFLQVIFVTYWWHTCVCVTRQCIIARLDSLLDGVTLQ